MISTQHGNKSWWSLKYEIFDDRKWWLKWFDDDEWHWGSGDEGVWIELKNWIWWNEFESNINIVEIIEMKLWTVELNWWFDDGFFLNDKSKINQSKAKFTLKMIFLGLEIDSNLRL